MPHHILQAAGKSPRSFSLERLLASRPSERIEKTPNEARLRTSRNRASASRPVLAAYGRVAVTQAGVAPKSSLGPVALIRKS
jgi:hypothetical protein